eukprot:GILI01012882.1.p1 GENE.GILI01012882.1~~GILI01012882.1.p1  ORF type:complete len:251 (+),score=10.66 GILI01012882.1:36-755(+)
MAYHVSAHVVLILSISALLLLPTVNAAQCPQNITSVTALMAQVQNGVVTPYMWSISPTYTTSDPPLLAQPCSAPGYISKYSLNTGVCEMVAAQAIAPTVLGNMCVYNFMGTNESYLTLSLSCSENATNLTLIPAVSVLSPTAGTSHYTLIGSYSGVCGEAESDGECRGGCAFTIVFFCCGAVYAAGTVVWNYVKGGKRGKEIATNGRYWRLAPSLVKDGARNTYRAVCCRKDPPSYAQV